MKSRDHVMATAFLIKKYRILFIIQVKGGVDRLKGPKHSDHRSCDNHEYFILSVMHEIVFIIHPVCKLVSTAAAMF